MIPQTRTRRMNIINHRPPLGDTMPNGIGTKNDEQQRDQMQAPSSG